MKKINNIKLFEFSLENKESIIEDWYIKNEDLIISDNPNKPNELVSKNVELLELISTYNFAKKKKNNKLMNQIILDILEVLKYKNINYSEFVSFWSVVDLSYSGFCSIEEKEQRKIIKKILNKYIDLRHKTYLKYGYTPVTLQVGRDAKAHKQSGSLGNIKVSSILKDAGFEDGNHNKIEDFLSFNKKKFIETDKKGKKLFKDILKYFKINFKWSSKKEDKMPDFLFRYRNNIYILEHKHMKEGGGGQNKQMNEIISLIEQSERKKKVKIYYISFLDGTYFNLLSDNKSKKDKIKKQITNINNNLEKNERNYFVNTAGFTKFVEQFK
ncbi:MAG: hypothetical protein L3J07_01385 [Candidatus Magasanikbacteria bacterium]|nr:hypothetical protein [Candidatus Magasanikbacteria bacterium]